MIKINEYNHSNKKLWCKFGAIVASREIRKTLGIAISSDDSYTWWLIEDENRVVGFGAVAIGKKVATFHHSYIYEEYRKKGLYAELLETRIEFCKKISQIEKITAVATEHSKPILEKSKFYEISKRGQYFTMRLFLKKTGEK